MASEVKTKGKQYKFHLSANLHKRFKTRCKKLNISAAQRLRDLMQADLKEK